MTMNPESEGIYERPEAQGLFDPAQERDACGVGFIANLKGVKSHRVVANALHMLENLEHRGAVGADPLAGDGAGILIQIPHEFFADEMKKAGVSLPKAGDYAIGHVFMPRDARLVAHCQRVWERIVREEGFELLGWRDVPVDNSCLSELVRATEPVQRQVIIKRPDAMKQEDFERRLFLIRKIVSNAVQNAYKNRDIGHYTVSLSSRTLVYKGMFLSYQVAAYYKDLSDERVVSAMALVHQRFSTNTFPSWKLAHPYRMVRPQRRNQHAARQRQTGWPHAKPPSPRPSSARTSSACGRSRTKASPTPPASITPSNSSTWAATASRTQP